MKLSRCEKCHHALWEGEKCEYCAKRNIELGDYRVCKYCGVEVERSRRNHWRGFTCDDCRQKRQSEYNKKKYQKKLSTQ